MYHLYIYNDNIHSFRYVWAALMEHAKHNTLQAEQCCLIADANGKCQIKQSDDIMEIQRIKENLEDLDLKVEILNENYA